MLLLFPVFAAAMLAGSQPPPAPSPAPAPVTELASSLDERTRAARLQTALARTGFSPGLIDGRPGRKTRIALEHFQRAKSLRITGTPDDATLAALALPIDQSWTRSYRVTQSDLDLITGPIPQDWHERADLSLSGYADLHELLAERGWCSVDLVSFVNPGADLAGLGVGDEVLLPDVPTLPGGRAAAPPRAERLEIDLTEKLVLGFDAAGAEVLLLHCSIAASVAKRPAGELRVKVLVTDPDYTFDPKDWPEVENVDTKLRIAPGPRCPVGSAWIGLDKPGYGIHGTVRPQDIGKTGSHGCFRLTNWDALRLVKSLKIGAPVLVRE